LSLRRPTFFISSRSHSADLLASELILALCDQHPKTEGVGVVGKWTSRTRVSAVADLDELQAAGKSLGPEEALKPLKENLLANLPQVAILVGYSPLHHELAGFFKQNEVPVILYEVTPQLGLQGIKLDDATDRIKTALSIHKTGSAFIRAANIPFHYIGTPYRDRVAKVLVNATAFDFLNDKPLITLFPGGYGEALNRMLPMFAHIASGILAAHDCQIVVSLREEQDYNMISSQLQQNLKDASKVHLVLGMHLELLSLSRLAITGAGAITIEAAILRKPFIPIYDQREIADSNGLYSLVNQSLGRKVVKEYSNQAPAEDILTLLNGLINDGSERSAFIQQLEEAQEDFLGSASDNAADFIANEVGLGKKKAKASGAAPSSVSEAISAPPMPPPAKTP